MAYQLYGVEQDHRNFSHRLTIVLLGGDDLHDAWGGLPLQFVRVRAVLQHRLSRQLQSMLEQSQYYLVIPSSLVHLLILASRIQCTVGGKRLVQRSKQVVSFFFFINTLISGRLLNPREIPEISSINQSKIPEISNQP